MARVYDSADWQQLRAATLERDGGRCTVQRLLGGECSRRLDVHHVVPRASGGTDAIDNLVTACSRHHPSLEAVRRYVARYRERDRPRCPHRHVTPEGRRQCEARLARAA